MRTSIAIAAAVAALLASANTARADWPRAWVLPPVAADSEIHGEVMLGRIDSVGDDTTLLGLEVGARHRIDQVSLFGAIPIAHARNDGFDGTSLGNLTGGVSFLLSGRVRGDRYSAWALSASLSAPTASDGGESRAAAATHAVFRVPDPGRYLPDTTTLRLMADWRTGGREWFFQTEFGTHALIIDGADDEVLLRLGLGGGIELSPTAALVGELTTMSDILDDDEGDPDFLHTLDAGIRFRGGHSIFGIRLYVPLDDGPRDLGAIGIAFDVATRL